MQQAGDSKNCFRALVFRNGAITGTLSVVTKDVPLYAIVLGSPAKFLKWRHPGEIAARLQALAWWVWDHATLRRALPDFRSLSAEAFLERHEPLWLQRAG